MPAATTQATTTVAREFTNSPILARSLVNWTKRNDGKWQLEAKHHLAQDQKRRDFSFARKADHQNCGQNCDGAGHQAANPWFEMNLQKTFHDDLTGEGSRQG